MSYTVDVMAPDPRTVTISLPPRLLREVDRLAESEGRSRSELFREALRQYLRRVDRWEEIFAFGERIAEEQGVSEDDVTKAVQARRRSRGRTRR